MTSLGFYLLTLLMLGLILVLYRHNYTKVTLIFFTWLAYVVLLTFSGVLQTTTMPPRVPLLLVLPAFTIIFWAFKQNPTRELLKNIPIYVPVYIQSFRILVELLIYSAYKDTILPVRTTFEGINYDIVTGITALIVAFLLQKNILNLKSLLIWNIIGLWILTITVYSFISTFYLTNFMLETNYNFLKLPTVFLPAILMPIAVFLHLFSIKQVILFKKKQAVKSEL